MNKELKEQLEKYRETAMLYWHIATVMMKQNIRDYEYETNNI